MELSEKKQIENGTAFIKELNTTNEYDEEESVLQNIWGKYEHVIIDSLITSFGLDFIVRDQYGGDVDTIQNVRKIGTDEAMEYKNIHNKETYEGREKYDTAAYHGDRRYTEIVSRAKEAFNRDGTQQEDAYVPGNTVIPRGNKTIPRGKQGQLDHVIAAEEIHNDPGRILAGIDGKELANDPENLRYTNAALNNNMRQKSAEEYIAWCEQNPDKANYNGKPGEPLPEDVKKRLRDEYNRSKKNYDAKVNRAYYTSPKFAQDTALAAGKAGLAMGARQALGFVFVEIWFAAKEELQNSSVGKDLKFYLEAVGRGIQKGFENAKKKYKELIAKLEEGFAAGALASLTTTICNIFFTTAKNLVKCIRQIYASVVQAGKVLLFNPDNLMLGDRIKATAVILTTGASVLLGTIVGDLIGKTPIGLIPVIGQIVQTFCASMVSGLISCSLLIFLDRSKFMNRIIDGLNRIPTEVNNFKEVADAMERLAAKLANLDIDKFKEETQKYNDVANCISACENEDELNDVLLTAYRYFNIRLPWTGEFDAFMSNKENHLVFE